MTVSFLQQSLLWGLLAISIPVIIHLLNRRRHRTVKWAAMEFLLKATRESRGRKKLKYIIILTSRALAIAALIFAISRPLVGGFLGWGGSSIDTVILILDRSASMEQLSKESGQSKRLSAIASVQKSLESLNNPRLVLIDSATATAQNVPSPDALNELSATFPTDTRASIPSLISTAIDYVTETPLGRTEIWVASDLQESDWAPGEGSWEAIRTGLIDLPQKTTLRVLSMTSPIVDNIAISVLSSRRNNDELILDIRLVRSDNKGPLSIPITYSLNGTRTAEQVTFNGQSYQFQKRLQLGSKEGEGYGFISIPADANPRDNVSFFAYGDDAPTKTFLVSEGGESPTWLSLASAPPGFGRSQCIEISPGKAHEIDWQGAALVIWQAPLPSGPVAQQLNSFIEGGGAALIFPPRGESDHTFLGIQWGQQDSSPKDQYFIVNEWDQTDGPLRNGLEGTIIPLPKLKAIKRRSIIGEATALASWDDGAPFLVRRVIGDGTAIFIATLPDYSWSNLGDADVLLPTTQRMIALGDSRFGSAYAAIAGSPGSKLSSGEIRNRLDTHSVSTSGNAPYEAGVWKLGERLLATNRPKSEDDWFVLGTNKMESLLQGANYKLFEDTGEADSLAREIWRAMLIAMLIFLITEAILCLQPKLEKAEKKSS